MIYSIVLLAATPFCPPPDLSIKNNPFHVNTFQWRKED